MPRRSSRARSSNAPSSNSTTTLKNTQPNQRSESADEPVEDNDSQATEPIMQPRRSRRNGADETSKESTQKLDEDEEEDAIIDQGAIEEEVTRCICGQTEYPGPSNTLKDMVKGQLLETSGDELGSFFVCCDNCSVWQHGGCVGLTNEESLPDLYYCEECKPDLHKIIRGTNGAKASLYRPVLEADLPSPSPSASSDQRKDSKGSKSSEPAKRRATMNSRGAYDEDEMLRQAIEQSKHDGSTGTITGALGKRVREDGDDSRLPMKRQRTTSSSASDNDRSISPGTTEPNSRSKSHLRAVAVKTSKDKEIRDRAKADAAAAKAEAANRRNARSERRRGEDSPPPSPSLSPPKALHTKTKPTSGPNDSTPPANSNPKKKTAASRFAASRRGRLGRNQYTRDRDIDSDTPMRDTSHDRNGVDHSPNGIHSDVNGTRGNGKLAGGSGKQSKAKTHPARTSLNEMKRRVAAILEFVGQMQTKANTGTSNSGKDTPNSNGSTGKASNLTVAGLVKAVEAATADVNETADDNETETKVDGTTGNADGENGKMKLQDDSEFRKLGSADMMEALTKELVSWQSRYGVWSR